MNPAVVVLYVALGVMFAALAVALLWSNGE